MIKNIGVDIIENKRIENNFNDEFIRKILNDEEIKILNSKNKKIEFMAGRFAAKEAIIKLFKDKEKINILDVTILNDKTGKPIVKYKDYTILLSISHEKNYSIAFAILL